MKLKRISITSPAGGARWEGADLEAFQAMLATTFEPTPLAETLLKLCEENAWSSQYTVSARFGPPAHELEITHEAFIQPCIIGREHVSPTQQLTAVRDAVLEHLAKSRVWMWPSIEILQRRYDRLEELRLQIPIDQAKAAIIATYPAAVDAKFMRPRINPDTPHFAFVHKEGAIYVAVEIHNSWRAAHIRCDWFVWERQQPDFRRNVFFSALAIQFAARELRLSASDILAKDPVGEKRPAGWLAKSVLILTPDQREYTVEFDDQNLPVAVRPHLEAA